MENLGNGVVEFHRVYGAVACRIYLSVKVLHCGEEAVGKACNRCYCSGLVFTERNKVIFCSRCVAVAVAVESLRFGSGANGHESAADKPAVNG